MVDKILKVTGLSVKEYESIIMEKYMTLTAIIAKSTNHQQLLLIHKPLNRWFLNQVKKVNREFLEDTKDYRKISKVTTKGCYLANINKVTRNYPSALIAAVKHNDFSTFLKAN